MSRRRWKSPAPIRAAPGMVITQAQTMRRVTPQRTAVRRRVAPTPTIAPVMVCVVLTGMPKCAVPARVSAPAASAAKPPKGVSLVMRCPMVLMIRQPPAMVPPPMARWQQRMTQRGGDNAHAFLGVVGAVAQAVSSRGKELQAAKPTVNFQRALLANDPTGGDGDGRGDDHADDGREKNEQDWLRPAADDDGLKTGARHCGAAVAAHQGVR